MIYYHVSSCGYEGKVLRIGNKPLQKYIDYILQQNVDSFECALDTYNQLCANSINKITGRRAEKWLCERIFESIRIKQFPSLPSRLQSVYLCESYEEATLFNKKMRNGTAKIYKVEIASAATSFDMDLFTEAEEMLYQKLDTFTYNKAKELATEYWRRNTIQFTKKVEFLYFGEVVLQKEI